MPYVRLQSFLASSWVHQETSLHVTVTRKIIFVCFIVPWSLCERDKIPNFTFTAQPLHFFWSFLFLPLSCLHSLFQQWGQKNPNRQMKNKQPCALLRRDAIVFIHPQFFLSQSQASKRLWLEEGRDFRRDIVAQILLHEHGFSVSNFKPVWYTSRTM